MVQSKVYSMEQIDVPANFENILKTYAKAVIKTQPYDLLRWSAMYFRCLATDKVPPVKDRLETNCEHGRLTRGYLKVLLRQIGRGFHVTQETLQDFWKGLCLLEEDLLKFMSLSRMLYWNKIHWLKLFAVMVGSLNNNLKDTAIMLCELLTESPEGSSSPIPLWMFKECYTFIAQLDCSREQTFIDSRMLLENGDLEAETIEPSCPILPSTLCSLIEQMAIGRTKGAIEGVDDEALSQFRQQVDNIEEMLRESGNFRDLMSLLNQVVQSGEIHSVVNLMPVRDKRALIEQSSGESSEAHHANDDETAHLYADQEKILREIGSLWSWVYQFAQCTSDDSGNNKSFNFISTPPDLPVFNENSCQPPEVESPLAGKIDAKLTDDGGDLLPGTHPPTDDANEKAPIDTSNIDDDVIDVGAFLREAQSAGLFQVSDTPSVITFLSRGDAPHAADNQLRALKDYLEQCTDTFQDINELLHGFTAHQNNSQSDGELVKKIPNTSAQMATISREDSSIDDKANISDEEKIAPDDPNIINVFAKSGIEADEDLIRAAIAEQMILGLIEKTIRDSEDTLRVIDEGEPDGTEEAPKDAEPQQEETPEKGEVNQESQSNSTESENKVHGSVEVESFAEKPDNKQVVSSIENDNSTKDSRESQPEEDGATAKNDPSGETEQEVNNMISDSDGKDVSVEKEGAPGGVPSEIESSQVEPVVEEVDGILHKASAENDSIESTTMKNGDSGKHDEENKLESSPSIDTGSKAVESNVNGVVESETKNDRKATLSDSSGEVEVSTRVSIDAKPGSPHESNADSLSVEKVAPSEVMNGNDSVTDSNPEPLVSKSDLQDDEVEKVDDKSAEALQPPQSQSKDCEKSSGNDDEDVKPESYSCTVGPILGIGAAVSPSTIAALMEYLTERAKEQNGMIYPRNFDEEQCPPLYDDVK
uniref:RIIa domain-containing protein n=1 Tax=Phlebotomus papatasi TaxID=29031 RepID=A0A1B0DA04_PHLPP